VAELNRNNITSATYVLYPNEGHTIARVENVLALTAKVEQFFADCLGGRMEATGG
jgi:dipeptidyl aminopeptidase/acylaminoacyl peptidase